MTNPAETAYLSFRDGELFNDVWLVLLRRREVVVHTFLWVVLGHCLRAGFMESRNFFVLRLIQVKFHIRTRLIESFPTTYWLWWCAEEKWHFTPVHTLRQLKHDEALFPPVHNKVTRYARLAVIFCTFECSYSSVLRPILLKLHI